MPWWGWITIGALMLAAELAFVDADFYLVLLGVSALAVGGFELAGIPLAWWVQWLVFAGLSVVALVFFRQRIYVMMRPPPEGAVREGVTGEVAHAVEAIAPGAAGRVALRGSQWTAINAGESTIEAGSRCTVTRSEGLTVHVRPND